MSNNWKYQVVEVKPSMMGSYKPDALQEAMDRQGRLGWELVNVIVSGPMYPALLVFKKPG
jgi:hypothetical protein